MSPGGNAAASGHDATTRERELRCRCGSLLARRIGDRIELKCRRCKRVVGLAVIVQSIGECPCEPP